ncbi:unnamed protein product [Prorocentrum cordatum]|uniref:Mei2-like C-terminal RNA recognition motif domain-containing protein n=1 Tax=Prorocentrum cordatum TaxID=2364126 RepID=A0ABN9UJN1_9DINO|nr:unnamed protein product [Polarella glacialis]
MLKWARAPTNGPLMMRNVPTTLSRDELVDLLNRMGFEGQFDLVYLPMHLASKINFGYAFVNLLAHQHAMRFWKVFQGFSSWPASGCCKVCAVSWGNVQGFGANFARYRKSAIMHNQNLPDLYRPAIFHNGRQVLLPHTAPEPQAMLECSSSDPGTQRLRRSCGQFVRVPARPNIHSTIVE